MEIKTCIKPSFCVIGKQGSTLDGDGFIQRLWQDANSHYGEVASLAKTDENGNPVGFWGAMSDLSMSFEPWENGFTQGLYLAGVEAADDAEAPEGWAKWVVPGFEYLCVKVEAGTQETFPAMLAYMEANDYHLAGAVHDFIDPKENGQSSMFFPVRPLRQ